MATQDPSLSQKPPRIRLTEESIASIAAATMAKAIPVAGGYQIEVSNDRGGGLLEQGTKADRKAAVYPTQGAARKALARHNPSLPFEKPKAEPFPSMRKGAGQP